MSRRSCPACGEAVPDRPTLCPFCGANLAETSPPGVPRWATRSWAVLVVALGVVNVVLDLYLGRNRQSGVGLVVLALTWALWWVLVAVMVTAAVIRIRASRR